MLKNIISFESSSPYSSLREQALLIATTMGLYTLITTELLSLTHALRPLPVLLVWIIFFLIISPRQHDLLKPLRSRLTQLTLIEQCFACILVIISTLTLIIALLTPPSIPDSLTYHIPRILHWIQNNSIEHYPTHIIRQLFSPPWQEYAGLHLYLLTGGDQFINLFTWITFIGTILAGSLIAKELGAKRLGQLLSGVLIATLPMAILQIGRFSGEIPGAFWLAIAFYAFLKWQKNGAWQWILIYASGIGLGCLTKGTIPIFSIPLILWSFIHILLRPSSRAWKQIFLSLALILIILTPFISRNVTSFGWNFFSSTQIPALKISNASINGPTVTANIIRGLCWHLATPWNSINDHLTKTIYSAANLINVPLDNKSNTMSPFKIAPSKVAFFPVPMGLHFIPFIIAIFCLFRNPNTPRLLPFFLCLLTMNLLFCATIRWGEVITARYQIPLFILMSAWSGAVLSNRIPRLINTGIAIILFLSCLQYVFWGDPQSLFGKYSALTSSREKLLFNHFIASRYNMLAVKTGLERSGCSQVGLMVGEGFQEHLFIDTLKPIPHLRIEHVLANNHEITEIPYPQGLFSPCAIIAANEHFDTFKNQQRLSLFNKNFCQTVLKGSKYTRLRFWKECQQNPTP